LEEGVDIGMSFDIVILFVSVKPLTSLDLLVTLSLSKSPCQSAPAHSQTPSFNFPEVLAFPKRTELSS
jgi:hypothetical protein